MTRTHLQAVPDPDDDPPKPKAKPRRRRRVLTRRDGSKAYPVRYPKPDGTTGQKTFDTAEQADEFRREMRARRRTGLSTDTSMSIAELARKWAVEYVAPLEDATQAMHIGGLTNRLLPFAGEMLVTAWSRQTTKELLAWIRTSGDVRECRREDGKPFGRWDEVPVNHPDRRPAGPATERTMLQTGSLMMQDAMDRGLRSDNPFAKVSRRAEKPAEKRALTMEELTLLAEACDALGKPTAKVLILVRAFTGMRMQDARALEWRDVDLERGWIVVRRAADHKGKIKSTKSGKEEHGRKVPIRGLGLAVLRQHHVDQAVTHGLVFRAPEGGMIVSGHFRTRDWLPIRAWATTELRRRLEERGIAPAVVDERCRLMANTVMHELRHTFPAIVGQAKGDVPMEVAMAWGGWKSPSMWARYSHLWDEASERAADALGDALGD